MSDLRSPTPGRFAATLLRSSAPGLASATARRILEEIQSGGPTTLTSTSEEGTAVPGAEDAFGQWRATAETHLGHLAASIRTGRPEIFENHVLWSHWAFHARGMGVDSVALVFRSLAETLRSEMPAEVGGPAAAAIEASLGILGTAGHEPPTSLRVETGRGEYAARYLMALLEGERDRALSLVDAAREEGGFSIPEVYQEVFLPALAEIGRLWLLGEVHVAEEHFATATTSLAISRLYLDLPRKEPTGKTIVTVAVEGELHELGIRIVSDFFTMDGWRVVHLGSSVPGGDLRRGALDFGADLIAISTSLVTHLDRAERLIADLREDPATASLPILVGGRAFSGIPGYGVEIGASAEANDVESAVRVARELVGLPPRG